MKSYIKEIQKALRPVVPPLIEPVFGSEKMEKEIEDKMFKIKQDGEGPVRTWNILKNVIKRVPVE